MQGQSRHYIERRGQADHQLRGELLVAAHGENREAAIAALGSLQRVYHLRLPLVEARLGLDPGLQHAGAGGSDQQTEAA